VQVSTIGVVCGLGHWATPALGQPGQQSLALRCACSNINKRYVCVARGGGERTDDSSTGVSWTEDQLSR
jgi:hypothetical protein